MARGRPRKPTAMKRLSGTLQPCRTNPNEPVPAGELPPPPAELTPAEQDAWRILAECVAPGVATLSDMPLFYAAAKLFAELRGNTISDSRYATFLRCLTEMGMTPACRSRITAKKDVKNDRFAYLDA